MQVFFGNRPLGRLVPESERPAFEKGAALVYSLGPTGALMTGLFPCSSELASWREEAITWVQQEFSAIRMQNRLRRDLKDLAAYCRVTSLDAQASLADKLRIWWLSRIRSRQIEGNFTYASMRFAPYKFLGKISEASWVALLETLLKPIIFALILAFVAASGRPALKELWSAADKIGERFEFGHR